MLYDLNYDNSQKKKYCNKISKPFCFSQPTISIQSPTPARTPSGEGIDQYTTDATSVYDRGYISRILIYPLYRSEKRQLRFLFQKGKNKGIFCKDIIPLLYQHISSNQVNQFVQLLHFSRLADNNFMKRPGMRYNYSANGLRFIPSIPNKQSQQY